MKNYGLELKVHYYAKQTFWYIYDSRVHVDKQSILEVQFLLFTLD